MKVMLVHNCYGKFSGEEAVVNTQKDILKKNGVDVCTYTRSSDEIDKMVLGKFRAFFSGIYNPMSAVKFKNFLVDELPDIVHIHNLFPLISPSIIDVCKRMGIPVVMTLHNFRLICPNGLLFNKGQICEKCAGGKEWNCILNNCEHSLPKSIGYALRNWVARVLKIYISSVDGFIALSEFQKKKLSENGIPGEKISVIPNAFHGNATECDGNGGLGDYVLYLGRFSEEKGIDVMLRAAEILPDVKFKLLGNGYEDYLGYSFDNVDMPGFKQGAELKEIIQNARVMIMSSICYEGFPMSLLDAMSNSKAVVVPDIGAFTEIINNGNFGYLFRSGDPNDMAEKIKFLYNNSKICEEMGRAAKSALRDKYSEQVYFSALIALYKKFNKQS